MNYFLYRLRFSTPVHIGSSDSALGLLSSEDHFYADTLFSALCHTQIRAGEDLDTLLNLVKSKDLRITDSMPYKGEDYFFPRPITRNVRDAQEIPAEKRKAMKRVKWIPASAFSAMYDEVISFGSTVSRTQAAITDGDNAVPYDVGLYVFAPDCGLYFIAALRDLKIEKHLTSLIAALALDGIGGRVSSGFGKFEVEDIIYLNEPFDAQTEFFFNALEDQDAPKQMMLTSALPDDGELESTLEGASFQVIRRGGFVQSASHGTTPLKKHTQYYLTAGSVVNKRFDGKLFQVGSHGTHPVYRYSIPVFMGVRL